MGYYEDRRQAGDEMVRAQRRRAELVWEKEKKAKEEQAKRTTKLCTIIHDLLGPFDGRDPETDGPIDLETSGARIRAAQAVLAEVE